MKVIVVGCGKMGSGLAQELVRKGHTVTVVGSSMEEFAMLGKGFKGDTIVGVAFDKQILEQAGIERADAVVACTKSDETNALIGRISRNTYRVPRVISRLYDPRKAEIYRSLGIQTISATEWGVKHAIELLSYDQLDIVAGLGNGGVDIVRVEATELLVGKKIVDVTAAGEFTICALSRQNQTFLPTLGTVIEKGDVLYYNVMVSSVKQFKHVLGLL
ncbi:MAG TPA: TrkA family potassium uptake protein [Clostridia bacterium]|nr:TrkA family potassium uptake protein [Clostridia bacterium]